MSSSAKKQQERDALIGAMKIYQGFPQGQIVDSATGVDIEQFFIVHDRSLHHFDVRCA